MKLRILDQDSNIVDVSLASTKEIVLKSTSGLVLTKTASFFTDGSDGWITYTTISGDIDAAGRWYIQGHVTLPTGDFHSAVEPFQVSTNIT